ncbi:peptidoglycan-binding domain-containing protein [uncultured Sulfitobacter sp.]|uniref:peptidoglycan-binding domain-containing protein n=1 Tax=uncultured Sulfitobacter sp. TaxID=191468 RepID=UPI002638FC8C|nr:peptidoglycan-binding domain-containing protein [uncultured Sulfitobacter sp.]
MIKRALGFAFVFMSGVGSAGAEPCVLATFDKPLEWATSVVTRHADVPSPQFPGLWQEGVLDGYFYTVFANGEGTVASAQSRPDWKIRISCPAEEASCGFAAEGTPPETANRVADVVAQCLKGEAAPEDQAVPPEPAAPCGLATLEGGSNGKLLQRLLIIAGADPGPVDGFVGNDTRKALSEVLGTSAATLETTQALAALDAFLCK